jgi:hypothetical protein
VASASWRMPGSPGRVRGGRRNRFAPSVSGVFSEEETVMQRLMWLWSLVAVVPLVAVGAWFGLKPAGAQTAVPTGSSSASLSDCCTPDCCPPECWPECCPECCASAQVAKEKPVATASNQAKTESYTCPLTGEELACPNCCPLKQQTAQASTKNSYCPPCPFCP